MTPYEAGYDFGKNGANGINCHFAIFQTVESMKEWERGKNDAELSKAKELVRKALFGPTQTR